jgi:hypothetical protein
MLEDVKPVSLLAACWKHFGYRPGEGLKEFSVEMEDLTPKDREDLIKDFSKVGIPIAPAA